MATLDLVIVGRDLPGRRFGDLDPICVGVQRGRLPDQLVPGDAEEAVFHLSVHVVTGDGDVLDFRGPSVHGPRGKRFVYLTWGQTGPEGQLENFRRAKIFLADLDPEAIAQAMATGVPSGR